MVAKKLKTSRLSATGLLIFLVGCGHQTPFTNYQGVTLSDQEVATVKESLYCRYCVQTIRKEDDTPVFVLDPNKYSPPEFKLTPGRYRIYYFTRNYNISPVYRDDTVELKAGHSYKVITDWCYVPSVIFSPGVCWRHKPYTNTIWIEDEATGEVLAGEKWY
jgi:hypothetical protein